MSQRIVNEEEENGNLGRKKKEKRQEEQLLYQADLLEHVSDAVISTDSEFRIKSWNRAAEQLYGWQADEVIGAYLPDLVPMTYVDQEIEEIIADFKKEGNWSGEVKQKERSGAYVYVYASVTMLRDQAGRDIGAIAVNRDISDRKRTEEQLRESEERFSKAFFSHPTAMEIIDLESWERLEVNASFCSLFGYTREEMEASNVCATKLWRGETEAQKRAYRQIQEKGYIQNFPADLYHKSGKSISVLINAAKLELGKGNLIMVSFVDITERKQVQERLERAQRELTELNNRFQVSTQAAKVGIWDWDVDSDTLIWDDTMFAIYGVSKDDFSGKSGFWQNTIHPEDLQPTLDAMVDALKGIESFDVEFRIIRPDHSVHYIKAKGMIQRYDTGRARRVIGTNWDITKEKEAERQKIRARQLELKNKELEQFAYAASHDLQEPLHTVEGFITLLRKHYQPQTDDKSNEYLELISESITRMNKLIRGLLDYSRIGAQEEMTSVACNKLVKHITKDLSAQITETNAVITFKKLPQVKGYETELRVLFQNLISNAIKFHRNNEPPKVSITAEAVGEYWQFCITDNGIGIAPQHQQRIFAIFQRLHPQHKYPGTGIGLSHCQKIVELHGGKIWVESRPKKGSQFYFTIPQ